MVDLNQILRNSPIKKTHLIKLGGLLEVRELTPIKRLELMTTLKKYDYIEDLPEEVQKLVQKVL